MDRREVVVVGAGTMGHGIAQVAALAGHSVTLIDTSRELAERGLDRIRANLDGGVERGKVTPADRDAALMRTTVATEMAGPASTAWLAIEAVPERMDLKTRILAELIAAAPHDAIFASNTSSLSITELQDATEAPGRVIGLHFFNPVHINRLVEIVRGRRTEDDVLQASVEFVRDLGKEPVVVNDSPGFATSRLGVLLGLEAMRMVEEGVASPADIDTAMELGYRHPMGPLRLTDLVGLDIRLAIAEYLHEKLASEAFLPPQILRNMVAAGKLGRKTGEGFYRWDEES